MMMILILLGAMDSMVSTNLLGTNIGTVGIFSEYIEVNESSNTNTYSYEPEIKENLQIRTNFLLRIGLDINNIQKSKPIPIPISFR